MVWHDLFFFRRSGGLKYCARVTVLNIFVGDALVGSGAECLICGGTGSGGNACCECRTHPATPT